MAVRVREGRMDIEIVFDCVPAQEVRQGLKGIGCRFQYDRWFAPKPQITLQQVVDLLRAHGLEPEMRTLQEAEEMLSLMEGVHRQLRGDR